MNKTLLKLIWALTSVVFLIGVIRVITTRPHRSADQKILIERSK